VAHMVLTTDLRGMSFYEFWVFHRSSRFGGYEG